MEITFAKYITNDSNENRMVKIIVVGGKTWDVPMNSENSDYAEIMRQVEAGELTIQDAE